MIAFLPGLAFAGSLEDETKGCMATNKPVELRDCLQGVFHRRDHALSDQIASAANNVPGATVLRRAVISSKFESEQTDWRMQTDTRCADRSMIAREMCRLNALRTREAELSAALDAAMRRN